MQAAVDYKIMYEEALSEITLLKHQLAELQRLIFGSKNERFIPTDQNSAQLSLSIQAEPVAQCNVIDAKKITYTRTRIDKKEIENLRDHPVRMKLPDHLE